MKKSISYSALALTGLALAALTTLPATAQLIITPTFDSSITNDVNAAAIEGTINTAIAKYQAQFSNPITVTIKFQEGGGLGTSSTTSYGLQYSQFLTGLTANSTTADTAAALSNLPTGSNNPVDGTSFLAIKTANARALGVFIAFVGYDGVITLNTAITHPGSPGSTLDYSLLNVTEHEINEVLGLGSSLSSSSDGNGGFNSDTPFHVAPEDLYRYNGTSARSYSNNAFSDYSAGVYSGPRAYFSIDGTTNISEFNNFNNGGDYGDWASYPNGAGTLQVQDAFSGPTNVDLALTNEFRALNVIGYIPTTSNTAVPEPSAVAALIGMLVPGAFLLRRKLGRKTL